MANSVSFNPMTGGCACGEIRYTLQKPPLIIHSCHCQSCQRETGSAFAVNLLIEEQHVKFTQQPIAVTVPSESGKGQLIHRCPKCFVAVWSEYCGAGPLVRFIRVGTLDEKFSKGLKPDIHIYTEKKVDWVALPAGMLATEGFYELDEVWCKESIERWEAIKPKVLKWRTEVGAYVGGKAETTNAYGADD